MKSLLITCLMVASLSSIAQNRRASIADAKLGQIVLTDLSGNQLDAEALNMNQVMKLRIPVANNNTLNSLPPGSARVKIGFGSKMQLDPNFNMNAAGLNNYFTWTSSNSTGQLEIIGNLKNALPIGMNGIDVVFKVRGFMIGQSTITANFLITNDNPGIVLSDDNPNNNISFLRYNVLDKPSTAPYIKVNSLELVACAVNVIFSTDKEVNINRYDIEVSKDGITYMKVGEIAANNQLSYNSNFPITTALQSESLLVRIRSVDIEGHYKYSQPSIINAICGKALSWDLNVYPNPASNVRSAMISLTEGIFQGKYKVSLVDLSGQLIKVSDLQLNNVNSFRYNFGLIASGKYLIKVTNADGSQTGVLKFEKL